MLHNYIIIKIIIIIIIIIIQLGTLYCGASSIPGLGLYRFVASTVLPSYAYICRYKTRGLKICFDVLAILAFLSQELYHVLGVEGLCMKILFTVVKPW
jgi:hypothetical protein